MISHVVTFAGFHVDWVDAGGILIGLLVLIFSMLVFIGFLFVVAFGLAILITGVLDRIQAEQNRRDMETLERLRQTILARTSITEEDRDSLSKFPTPPPTPVYSIGG